MNIRLYGSVLREHWVLLAVGTLVAALLAFFTAFSLSLSPPRIAWKLKPTYGVSSILLVTQPGFPVGRANLIQAGAPTDAAGALISTYADPSRYDYLAGLYSQLAQSDEVVKPVLGPKGFKNQGLLYLDGGKYVGSFTSFQLTDASGNTTLPFVQIDVKADSAQAVEAIGSRVTASLIKYVSASEAQQNIPAKQRVLLSVVEAPTNVEIIKGRGLVLPLAVFILCIAAAIALAFFKENIKRDKVAEGQPTGTPRIGDIRPAASAEPGVHSVMRRSRAPGGASGQ